MDELVLAVDPERLFAIRATRAESDHLTAHQVEKQGIAIHEAGHAVVGCLLGLRPKAADIKGRSGGHTDLSDYDDDRPAIYTLHNARNRTAVGLAGLAATEVVLGYRLSGAHSDLRNVTGVVLEAISQGIDPEAPFVTPYQLPSDLRSPDLANELSARIRSVISEEWLRAIALCRDHRDGLIRFATILYERRRLSDDELAEALTEAGV